MSENIYMLTGDEGVPLGMIDVDLIQAEGTALSYALAAAAGDPVQLDEITAATLQRVGTDAFGYVVAVAARQLAEGVVAPLLEVLDRVREVGTVVPDLRAGLADARDHAMAVAVTLRSRAAEGGGQR